MCAKARELHSLSTVVAIAGDSASIQTLDSTRYLVSQHTLVVTVIIPLY